MNWRGFLLNRAPTKATASACVLRPAPLGGLHAQVPRHTPHHSRDAGLSLALNEALNC